MKIKYTKSLNQKGAFAVEMALVSIFFFTLLFGIIDFGRGIWAYNSLSHATRQGAHYAIVNGSGTENQKSAAAEQIQEIVRTEASLQNVTVITTWPDGDNNRGNRVRVEASYLYQPISLLGISSIPFTAASEMVISYKSVFTIHLVVIKGVVLNYSGR